MVTCSIPCWHFVIRMVMFHSYCGWFKPYKYPLVNVYSSAIVKMAIEIVDLPIKNWLVVWNLFFPYIGNNHPNWRSYFSEGFKPPTRKCSIVHGYVRLPEGHGINIYPLLQDFHHFPSDLTPGVLSPPGDAMLAAPGPTTHRPWRGGMA